MGQMRNQIYKAPFAEVIERVKERTGALVIGIRDGATGEDEINPAADRPIDASAELLYLGRKPVLGVAPQD